MNVGHTSLHLKLQILMSQNNITIAPAKNYLNNLEKTLHTKFFKPNPLDLLKAKEEEPNKKVVFIKWNQLSNNRKIKKTEIKRLNETQHQKTTSYKRFYPLKPIQKYFESQILDQSSLEQKIKFENSHKPKRNSCLQTGSYPWNSILPQHFVDQDIEQDNEKEEEAEVRPSASIVNFEAELNLVKFPNYKKKYCEAQKINTLKLDKCPNKTIYKNKKQEDLPKMNQKIEQHMNRYEKKDLFKSHLNCFKTTMYKPIEKEISIPKIAPKVAVIKKQETEIFSNFMNRRKFRTVNVSNTIEKQRVSQKKYKKINYTQQKQSKFNAKINSLNPEIPRRSKEEMNNGDFSPWETQYIF